MTPDVAFDLDPTPVERLELRGCLAESAKRDTEFEDLREHYLTVDELPDRLSEGLSEDKRRKYDVTYFLRKRDEMGERYHLQVSEHADAINRSFVFEFEYFDPDEEDVEHAVSRLLDSVKRIVDHLSNERYRKFRATRELYGVATEPLYDRDTRPDLDDGPPFADEEGHLIPENLRT